MNEQKSAVVVIPATYESQNEQTFQVSDSPNQENPILFDQFHNFDANFY